MKHIQMDLTVGSSVKTDACISMSLTSSPGRESRRGSRAGSRQGSSSIFTIESSNASRPSPTSLASNFPTNRSNHTTISPGRSRQDSRTWSAKIALDVSSGNTTGTIFYILGPGHRVQASGNLTGGRSRRVVARVQTRGRVARVQIRGQVARVQTQDRVARVQTRGQVARVKTEGRVARRPNRASLVPIVTES